MYIDHSVYPDYDILPAVLDSSEERADYVQRICAAWDYGLVPERATFRLFRGWQDVFDRYPLPHSGGYRAFRRWFGWPVSEGGTAFETTAERMDRREGRDDPCAQLL